MLPGPFSLCRSLVKFAVTMGEVRFHPYQRGKAIICPSRGCKKHLSHKEAAEAHLKSHPELADGGWLACFRHCEICGYYTIQQVNIDAHKRAKHPGLFEPNHDIFASSTLRYGVPPKDPSSSVTMTSGVSIKDEASSTRGPIFGENRDAPVWTWSQGTSLEYWTSHVQNDKTYTRPKWDAESSLFNHGISSYGYPTSSDQCIDHYNSTFLPQMSLHPSYPPSLPFPSSAQFDFQDIPNEIGAALGPNFSTPVLHDGGPVLTTSPWPSDLSQLEGDWRAVPSSMCYQQPFWHV
ncbi:hypothetical protein QCA50_014765 [Cerrena zonata]|uniref:C2H2-type domain-containing protein n=1 Tax=Cerrena zonata TaxID=2478898 RepID=A0AAW0FKG6_9APHY